MLHQTIPRKSQTVLLYINKYNLYITYFVHIFATGKSSNIETNQNSNEQLFQKTNFLCGNMLWDRCVGICK